MPEENFQKLRVWQEARRLVVLTYRHTEKFPSEERRFGLGSQMRRASVSVASNIAEGSKKSSKKERRRFHEIADTSLEELKSQSLIAQDLNFLTTVETEEILIQSRTVGRMLYRLNETLR